MKKIIFNMLLFALISILSMELIELSREHQKTQEKLIECQFELFKSEMKHKEFEEIKLDEFLNNREIGFRIAEIYTGIDKNIIKAQASLETGNFTSRRYKENHNLFGIGVYADDTEGVIYLNELQCILHYAKIINDSYDLKDANINEFEVGISKWAADEKYGIKVKRKYYELMRGE